MQEAPPGFEPGNGRFAIRSPESANIDTSSELRQDHEAEVPAVVSSSPELQFPPDLARVVAAWDRLPEAIKAGILALVHAAGEPNG